MGYEKIAKFGDALRKRTFQKLLKVKTVKRNAGFHGKEEWRDYRRTLEVEMRNKRSRMF